jgi:hypothetical protein
MARLLPSVFLIESALLAIVVAGACGKPAPPVPPGPPIPAEPEIAVGTMDAECDGLVIALLAWKSCPNLDEDDRDYIDAWIERAHLDFAASHKAHPDERALHAMAHNCRRATNSVAAATERCSNGPRPRE